MTTMQNTSRRTGLFGLFGGANGAAQAGTNVLKRMGEAVTRDLPMLLLRLQEAQERPDLHRTAEELWNELALVITTCTEQRRLLATRENRGTLGLTVAYHCLDAISGQLHRVQSRGALALGESDPTLAAVIGTRATDGPAVRPGRFGAQALGTVPQMPDKQRKRMTRRIDALLGDVQRAAENILAVRGATRSTNGANGTADVTRLANALARLRGLVEWLDQEQRALASDFGISAPATR